MISLSLLLLSVSGIYNCMPCNRFVLCCHQQCFSMFLSKFLVILCNFYCICLPTEFGRMFTPDGAVKFQFSGLMC